MTNCPNDSMTICFDNNNSNNNNNNNSGSFVIVISVSIALRRMRAVITLAAMYIHTYDFLKIHERKPHRYAAD